MDKPIIIQRTLNRCFGKYLFFSFTTEMKYLIRWKSMTSQVESALIRSWLAIDLQVICYSKALNSNGYVVDDDCLMDLGAWERINCLKLKRMK